MLSIIHSDINYVFGTPRLLILQKRSKRHGIVIATLSHPFTETFLLCMHYVFMKGDFSIIMMFIQLGPM